MGKDHSHTAVIFRFEGLYTHSFLIHTYLSTVILTFALMIPNAVPQTQNPAPPVSFNGASYALEAPKTPVLDIEDYAEKVATEHDLDTTLFKKLITCESRWKEDAAGDHGTSLGILQFKAPTFAHFKKKYDLHDYDYTEQDPYQQINLAARMIEDGYLGHWKNCARKIGWLDQQLTRK